MVTKRVGIFSGGGAKGAIQVSCLAELECVGLDFKSFDLFVGSSVGAINSLILSMSDFSARKLCDIYPGMLKKIFNKVWYPRIPIYNRKDFQNCWADMFYITKSYSDCKVPIIITSVDVCQDKMYVFKSWKEESQKETSLAVVQRSFAAPLYFGQINDPNNQCVWYDGGCASYNLPIDIAWEQSILNGWLNDSNIQIEFWAFGTGFSDDSIPYNKASKENFIEQVLNFLNVGNGGMARAVSRVDQVDKMVNRANKLSNISFKYYDIKIDKSLDKMDAIDKVNDYITIGKQMAQKPLLQIN